MKRKLCIKQKATLFMLLLISILMSTLYFQNRAFDKNYFLQIENVYKKSFDNINTLFKSQLLFNYKIATLNIQNEQFRVNLLKTSRFLKSVEIIDLAQSTKYSSDLLNNKTVLDVFANAKKEVFYKILVPIQSNNTIESYAQYIVDIRVFLQKVKDSDGSNGIVYIKDNDRTNDIFLKTDYKSDVFKYMVEECSSIEQPVVEVKDEFYVKKELEINNSDGELVANAIFFLDVTKERKDYFNTITTSMITTIVLFLIAAVIVNHFFNFLIKRINKNEETLKKINKNLEQTVENEINHRLEIQQKAQAEKQKNEQLLIHQSKLALLGEMIGNIAHQWRQPLMQLSAILMYLDAYNEKGKLTPEKFNKKINDGNSIIDFMSKTIEDFRNYYKPEKQKEKFFLKECIDNALFIIESSLKTSNISVDVTYNKENIELESFKNEFSQSLLNIITNAKDVLVLRDVKNAHIKIDAIEDESSVTIRIEDNAGGIEDEVMDKIFDPYFTTKHKSQGTGIGLYMTKMIIENNMDGSIEVQNKDNGAEFIIRLSK